MHGNEEEYMGLPFAPNWKLDRKYITLSPWMAAWKIVSIELFPDSVPPHMTLYYWNLAVQYWYLSYSLVICHLHCPLSLLSPPLFLHIHISTIMSSKYCVLQQDSRSSVAEDFEDSESTHMMRNDDNVLYQPRSKRNKLIISLHWIGHGVSILVIVALCFYALSARCNAPLTSKAPPKLFSEDFQIFSHQTICWLT